MEAVAAIDEDIMKRWLKNVPTKSRTNYNKLLKDVLARICQETATDIQKGIEIVRSDELVTHLRRYLAEKPLGTQKKIVRDGGHADDGAALTLADVIFALGEAVLAEVHVDTDGEAGL
ncbi:hypothetical protein J8273_4994 [Carpediemonas membranifera]|uniref:Uncharacterized protein n=1 Tax=Carpediemonas membranifera TaxID=201153 RepID=A0A8J6AWS8_9EUKA|nr:hypothetical protein J8273_4994 [Carpediemonas membranifera]|eukprot:KAG9393510.1 hypothetical protein J8273_4994 [Carpediemonas membranifera]